MSFFTTIAAASGKRKNLAPNPNPNPTGKTWDDNEIWDDTQIWED